MQPGEVEFKAPKVEIGDVVLWRQDNSDRPKAAVVNEVNNETCGLIVFPPSGAPMRVDGVRHRDDPRRANKDGSLNEFGYWTVRPRDEKITELLAFFENTRKKGPDVPATK